MEEQKKKTISSQEQKTNALRIKTAMKKHRKLYYKTLPVVFIVACLYTLGMPNYYNAVVQLVPEANSGTMGSLASIASSFGFNIGGGSKDGDAITPSLYPDFMSSVAFRTSLFDIKVQKDGEDRVMSYYDYLKNEQKLPWWSDVLDAFWGLFGSKKPEGNKIQKVNPFRLTPEQRSMVNTIGRKIECDINKRNEVISIKVTDQDPLVAATVADSVKERLQQALTEYRTKKARHDLAYVETLYKDAKAKYDRSCELYAEFMDSNQGVLLETVRLRQTKLENEMQMLYNNYNAISTQLLAAKAKVQEDTPAFTELQNATVPLLKAGPKRGRIVLIFMLLVFLCETAWILSKENELMPLLGLYKR